MSRSIVRGMSALAILLVGTSVATAFPIQKSTTSWSQNNSNNTLGTVGLTANVRLRNATDTANLVSYNGIASGFTTRVNSPTAQELDLLRGQSTFNTFCMELGDNLQGTVTTRIDNIPPNGAAPDGGFYVDEPNSARRAAYVVGNAVSILQGAGFSFATLSGGRSNYDNQRTQSAIQLAVWKIIYDAGITEQGNLATTHAGSGGGNQQRFIFTTAGAEADELRDMVDALLAGSWDSSTDTAKLGWGLAFRQNVDIDGVRLGVGQTLITATVPEPSTFAIAGLSGLAMLGYGLRRRKMARA